MELSTVVILALIFVCLYLFLKRFSNTRRPIKEAEFEQAGVKVSFCNGTIAIDRCIYDVNQVAGVTLKPLESAGQRHDNDTKNVVIQIDDHKRPTFRVNFVTRAQAEHFMLRLISALKQAGSPKAI